MLSDRNWNTCPTASEYAPKFSKADGSKKWESLEAENRIVFYGLQKGYAAFTVSASARQSVQTYITNQQEHHRKKTFREELVAFLRKSGVEFDKRYLD